MSWNLENIARRVKSSLESREFQFVEPFPSEVQTECSICLQILKEPYVVGCCGYRFCKSCLHPTIRSCPLCKTYNFSKLPDKQLERLLNQRPVYCLLQDNGCKWSGELCHLSAHLSLDNIHLQSACGYLPVPCPYCKVYMRRMRIPVHQGGCSSRPSNCMHCKRSFPYNQLSAHYKVCPNVPRVCKNSCGYQHHSNEAMDSHLANDCPLEMICCEYRFTGCGMRFLRKDLDDHMKGRTDLHLRQMKTKCKQLQDKEQKASSALKSLREDNAKLKEEKEGLYALILQCTSQLEELSAENEELRRASKGREIKKLKVTNLPPGTNKHNLKCVFGQFGTVSDIQLNKPHNAFIEYSCQSDFEEALQVSLVRGINLLKHRLVLEEIYS